MFSVPSTSSIKRSFIFMGSDPTIAESLPEVKSAANRCHLQRQFVTYGVAWGGPSVYGTTQDGATDGIFVAQPT